MFEAGTLTVAFDTICALRMRVSRSAMGSLMLMEYLLALPAGLDHAGDIACKGELADLVAGQAELAERAARAAGDAAAIALAGGVRVAGQLLEPEARGGVFFVALLEVVRDELQLRVLLGVLGSELVALEFTLDQSSLSHDAPLLLERETEAGEESLGFLVGLGRGGDRDVEAANGVDLVVLDLRENDLFLDADVVVATAVECAGGDAA